MPRVLEPLRGAIAPALRAILTGTLLLGSIGSCELPKPELPSIGAARSLGAVPGVGIAPPAAASAGAVAPATRPTPAMPAAPVAQAGSPAARPDAAP